MASEQQHKEGTQLKGHDVQQPTASEQDLLLANPLHGDTSNKIGSAHADFRPKQITVHTA